MNLQYSGLRGHCIPVDLYYLICKAKELDYHPLVILVGRAIDDYKLFCFAKTFTKSTPFRKSIDGKNEILLSLYNFFGKAFFSKETFMTHEDTHEHENNKVFSYQRFVIKCSKVLIMGLTYKENVPDTRESPVIDMINELKEFGVDVYGYDPLLSNEEIEKFSVKALDELNVKMDCVIVAVAHDAFRKMKLEDVKKFMNDKPVLIDVRGMFDGEEAERKGFYSRTL